MDRNDHSLARSTLGVHATMSLPTPWGGETDHSVTLLYNEYSKPRTIEEFQWLELENLELMSRSRLPALSETLLGVCSSLRRTWLEMNPGATDSFPSIDGPDDLYLAVGPCTIYINPGTKNDLCFVGYAYESTFDGEHGIGVMFLGDTVFDHGSASVANSEPWLAG